MKLHRRSQVFSFVCVFLFMLNPTFADAIKWNKLNKIEKHVVKIHKTKWDDYSEEKQKNILKKANITIKGIYRYKKWVKSLPKEKQIEIGKKFKEMKPKDFKKYADKLMKKDK